ncbi:MAG: hypothetical protein WC505_07600 [Patescibacteria group bacterium]
MTNFTYAVAAMWTSLLLAVLHGIKLSSLIRQYRACRHTGRPVHERWYWILSVLCGAVLIMCSTATIVLLREVVTLW